MEQELTEAAACAKLFATNVVPFPVLALAAVGQPWQGVA